MTQRIKTTIHLTEAFDGILKAPAGAPGTATATEPRPRVTLGDIAALLPKPRAQTRPTPPTPPTSPPTSTPATPNVTLTEAGVSPLPVYPWDPMPTSGDPLGLRERMDFVEAAFTARAVPPSSAAPHTPAADPASPLVEARFVEAHRCLDEILG